MFLSMLCSGCGEGNKQDCVIVRNDNGGDGGNGRCSGCRREEEGKGAGRIEANKSGSDKRGETMSIWQVAKLG